MRYANPRLDDASTLQFHINLVASLWQRAVMNFNSAYCLAALLLHVYAVRHFGVLCCHSGLLVC